MHQQYPSQKPRTDNLPTKARNTELKKDRDEMRTMIMQLQSSVMTLQNNELKRSSDAPNSEAKRLRLDPGADADKA